MANKIFRIIGIFLGYLWHLFLYIVIFPYLIYFIGAQLDALLVLFVFKEEPSFYWGYISDIIALVLILGGASLIFWSALVLVRKSKCFPFQSIQMKEFHPKELSTSGPYGIIRHPMLLGYLLILAGGAFILGSPLSLFWTIPLFGWAQYEYLLYFEERRLESWFGKKYTEYQQKIPGLIPGLNFFRKRSKKGR